MGHQLHCLSKGCDVCCQFSCLPEGYVVHYPLLCLPKGCVVGLRMPFVPAECVWCYQLSSLAKGCVVVHRFSNLLSFFQGWLVNKGEKKLYWYL